METIRVKAAAVDRGIGIGLTLVMVFSFSILAWRGNTDLTAGRFALFMDEQISYDQIFRILHPGSISGFFGNIADGGDQRYGRIFYNLTALFSFIPERVFGAPGMIVADRMTQALFLISAYSLFAVTFLENWLSRAALLFLLLASPFTAYFSTMPKPEPTQLLLFALFFFFHRRSGFRFGNHWFFLGAAFGAKISAITLVPLIAADSYLRHGKVKASAAPVSFVLGLVSAVPILLGGQWNRWMDSTFRNTGHAADDLSVNAFTWISHLSEAHFGNPYLFALTGVAGLALVSLLVRERSWKTDPRLRSVLLFIAGGLCLTVPILLKVKRVWGIYLHAGIVFFLIGLVIAVEIAFTGKGRRIRVSAVTLLASLIFAALTVELPRGFASFSGAAIRTESDAYRENVATYEMIIDESRKIRARSPKPVVIAVDPMLFQPDSTPEIQIVPFWGAFEAYASSHAGVFAIRKEIGDPLFPSGLSENHPAAKAYAEAWKKFRLHTREGKSPSCGAKPCYVRKDLKPNLVLLTLESLE